MKKRKNLQYKNPSSGPAGTTEEDDAATFGINYSQYPDTVLDKGGSTSPNSVEKSVIAHLKSFEGKQEAQADENAKDLNNTKSAESKKLDSIGEQEIKHAPT